MATIQGTRLTLSDTVGLAVDMSPVIQLIDPFDVGVLSYVGMSSLDKPASEVKHSWMEDTLRPLSSTITDNPLLIGGVTINVAAGTGVYFRANDIVKIDDELIRITAVATDALTTVAASNGRGWGGSTAAAHNLNSVIEIVSVAILEGDNTPGETRQTTKSQVDNYTQIFEDGVKVSATLEAVDQWAPGSEYARQLAKTMKSLMIVVDKTLIYGKPNAGTATVPRAMGGIRHFITTNVTSASGAQVSENLLLDQLFASYNNGGLVRTLFMQLLQKRGINKFLDPARRTGMDDKKAGAVVDTFMWDQGSVDITIDRWLPNSEIIGIQPEYIGFGPLASRTLQHEILPKASREVQKGQITGEYTAEVKSEKAHFRLYSLATSIV
jgi:Family of unknown function (DUF5309)